MSSLIEQKICRSNSEHMNRSTRPLLILRGWQTSSPQTCVMQETINTSPSFTPRFPRKRTDLRTRRSWTPCTESKRLAV